MSRSTSGKPPVRDWRTLWLRPADLIVFLIYGAMLVVFGPRHEPWSDEAQAWMLARATTLSELLFHYLRHEGHPALWYLLLRVVIACHLSYTHFWMVSGALCWAGVWALLRSAPFPFFLRALLPFTFFLGYQYPIVARSYALFPLLTFAAAQLYRERAPWRPIAMSCVLGLLANVSIHGTLVAIAFAAAYAVRLRRGEEARLPTRMLWTAGGIFACSVLFVAVCLWPTVGALPRVSPTWNRVIDALSVPEPGTQSSSISAPPASHTTASIAPPGSVAHAALAAAAPGSGGHGKLAAIPVVLSYAFAQWWPLAAGFDLLAGFYLVRRGEALLLLPVALLLAFLVAVYSAPWHLGLVWITMLAVLWAAWDGTVPPLEWRTPQGAVAWSLTLLAVLQLPWTYRAFRFDAREATSPDKAAAAYLQALGPGLRVAGFGMATGMQPYFAENPFFNQHLRFGYFAPDPLTLSPEAALASTPDVVITDWSLEPLVQVHGYSKLAQFCGTIYLPRPVAPGCLGFYTPGGRLPANAADRQAR